MVRHDWMNSSRDICFFKSKYGKIRHFRYDVIFFYMDIFEKSFLYLKVLVEYFQKMYRFNTIGQTVDEINAFEMSKKCYFLLSQHFFAFFLDFKCIYLVNGMSDSIKPIHFFKVLNENFHIKTTFFKNIYVEKNDVISNMADFAIFGLKKANIS